jgi:hypothetical protein
MTNEKSKDLDYWKSNAEEDYITTPISVLRYINELEQQVNSVDLANVVGQGELLHKLLQHLSDEDELIGNRTHQEIIDNFNQLG